jgi:sulfatase maturation enzyme AslB (radical SAM superfamily)
MKPVTMGQRHNYVAFFLTLACNLKCPWCINLHEDGSRSEQAKRKKMTPDEWVEAANRLVLRDDLPLTLQGGEPTLHEGFYTIANNVKKEIKMDLLTNMMFNVDQFIRLVPSRRFARQAPYAPIRVSFHPGQNDIDELIHKTHRLEEAGFRVGIYGIKHPDQNIYEEILAAKKRCERRGIDFRLKQFLGEWNGMLYGTFKYEGSVDSAEIKKCRCRTSELIVDPAGYVFRCHADLYKAREPIAHILDESFSEKQLDVFRPCDSYGRCNPCDVKITTNRFQLHGHTSVEICDVDSAGVLQRETSVKNA